jgi:integrase
LHKRGKNPVWYCTISDDFLQENGSIKRGRRKIRLGLVSKLSEEEARQLMDQIVSRINAKTGPTNLTTVRRFIEDHFKPEVVTHLKKSGRSHYKWLMDRQIIPAIGDMKLADVTLVHLQRLVNMKLETGLSVQTAKHIKGGLSAVFRHALALRVIEGFNPASAIRLPEMVRKERHTPTPDEARAIIEVLRDPSYDPMRQMVILSCATSVHYAEMMALRWKRVNLRETPTIADGRNLPPFSLSVRENFYRGSFGSTKTKARNRIEPLPEVVVEALAALKAGGQFTGPDDLVFANPTGGSCDEDVLRRKLKKAGELVGISWKVSWHCFRRYFATESDRKGMSQDDRQASLGHASSEITAHYTTNDIERRRPITNLIAADLVQAKAAISGT